MAIATIDLAYVDGRTARVPVGQREIAEWEGLSDGSSYGDAIYRQPVRLARRLAYFALVRTGEVVKGTDFGVWSEGVDSASFGAEEGETEAPKATGTTPSDEG